MAFTKEQGKERLLSLADLMRDYNMSDLALFLTGLTSLCRDLSTSDQLSRPILDDERLGNLGPTLEGLLICCSHFDAELSLIHQIRDLQQEIVGERIDRREAVLLARLKPILSGVKTSLNQRRFMYVPSDQAPYWNNMFWLGDEFLLVFSHKAKAESVELGNCITAGRWTSCVFHAMRLAEYGLRMLAQSVKVKLIDKGKVQPIEFADWNKVIAEVKEKIKKARTLPMGQRKAKLLQFYSDANDHCEYMKDIWRNEVSHTRRMYKKEEAFGVINRVKDFMMLLAKHYAKSDKRIRQIRANNARAYESLAQRD